MKALPLIVLPLAAAFAPWPAHAEEPADRWRGAGGPYLEAVHARIHPRWSDFLRELQRAPGEYQNRELAVVVELAVAPDGAVTDVRRTLLSNLKGFDDAPTDLLAQIGKLPPPPPAVRADDDRAHLRWRFTRKEPGCEERELLDQRLPLDEALTRLAGARRPDEAIARFDEARRADPAQAKAALPHLAEALARAAADDPDPARRAASTLVFARLPTGEPALLKLAGDKDRSVRQAALEALGTPPRTPAALAALTRALAGDDRAAAARALGHLGDKSAIPALAELLGRGTAPAEAAASLAQLGERAQAIGIINDLLAGDAAKRLAGAHSAAALAEVTLAPKLAAALPGASEEGRAAIVAAIAATGKATPVEARKAVIKALHDPVPRVRARACAALAAFGEKAAATRTRLIDALSDPDPGVRAAAGAALVPVAGPTAVDEINRAVTDKSPEVRVAVAAALAAHPFEGSPRLLAKLAADKDPAVKAAAAAPPAKSAPTAGDPLDLLRSQDPLARLRTLAEALPKS